METDYLCSYLNNDAVTNWTQEPFLLYFDTWNDKDMLRLFQFNKQSMSWKSMKHSRSFSVILYSSSIVYLHSNLKEITSSRLGFGFLCRVVRLIRSFSGLVSSKTRVYMRFKLRL